MSSASPCSLTLTSSAENPRAKGFTGPVTDELNLSKSRKITQKKKHHPPVWAFVGPLLKLKLTGLSETGSADGATTTFRNKDPSASPNS